MKERALLNKSSTNRTSLNRGKSNGHANSSHHHSKHTRCTCGESPLLRKHSPRTSHQSLGDHSSCAGNSPYCPHTKRYMYQTGVRDSLDSDYYADDDATHSGGNSEVNVCTCGHTNCAPHNTRISKHSLPDATNNPMTVVTIENNGSHGNVNSAQQPRSPDNKARRYQPRQTQARGVRLQALKRQHLSQPYSYDMCMCELPSTSNTTRTCSCMMASSQGMLSEQQRRGFSASAPNLAAELVTQEAPV